MAKHNPFQPFVTLKLVTIAACGITAVSSLHPHVSVAVTHVAWAVMEIANERSLRNPFDRSDDRDEEEEERTEE
ncbi:MAG: hypothetical protein J7641_03815 [Cyanobacteria bacterium SID2]|nr:hypothetical protein [Cyanobacteria bacterium SID2]MBP0003121.1 hypothetical protein [Cyanobacteria bacterium SBC]